MSYESVEQLKELLLTAFAVVSCFVLVDLFMSLVDGGEDDDE